MLPQGATAALSVLRFFRDVECKVLEEASIVSELVENEVASLNALFEPLPRYRDSVSL